MGCAHSWKNGRATHELQLSSVVSTSVVVEPTITQMEKDTQLLAKVLNELDDGRDTDYNPYITTYINHSVDVINTDRYLHKYVLLHQVYSILSHRFDGFSKDVCQIVVDFADAGPRETLNLTLFMESLKSVRSQDGLLRFPLLREFLDAIGTYKNIEELEKGYLKCEEFSRICHYSDRILHVNKDTKKKTDFWQKTYNHDTTPSYKNFLDAIAGIVDITSALLIQTSRSVDSSHSSHRRKQTKYAFIFGYHKVEGTLIVLSTQVTRFWIAKQDKPFY